MGATYKATPIISRIYREHHASRALVTTSEMDAPDNTTVSFTVVILVVPKKGFDPKNKLNRWVWNKRNEAEIPLDNWLTD